jgi:hypothetical protein
VTHGVVKQVAPAAHIHHAPHLREHAR